MLFGFESLKSLLKLPSTVTDNSVFQLHYRYTVAILLAFSILVNLKQYWGEAIQCISGHSKPKVVETFCWIETTFTVPSAENLKVGLDVPYPGIKKSIDKSDRKYHAYYQYVGLMLFFQAVLFCIPRFIWKSTERGLMKNLVFGLDAVIANEETHMKTMRLLSYIKSSLRTHDKYVTVYLLCEVINFISVVLQMVLMEIFLGGKFSSFGMEVMGLKENPDGPSSLLYPGFRVFPRMTKCTFYDFGTSGDIQQTDALCLMPLNVIHEKLYIFLFVWFVGLAVLSGLVIVFRFVSILQFQYREVALATHAPLCSKATIRKVCELCSFSDWFFIKLICKNMSPHNCRKILDGMAEQMPPPPGFTNKSYALEIAESRF